jgi:hypothetical protein
MPCGIDDPVEIGLNLTLTLHHMLPELNKERKMHPGTLEKYGKAIIREKMPGSYKRRKPMKPIICFIDDSKFEHDLVHHDIAPLHHISNGSRRIPLMKRDCCLSVHGAGIISPGSLGPG